MSANRPRDTKPELALRQALRLSGHPGYRINYRIQLQKPARSKGTSSFRTPHSPFRIPTVRPDITFVGRKLAIFVHGCYWHRCPKCSYPIPKNNTDFWQAKFDRNIARDEHKRRELIRLGWKVTTVWECDLKKRATATLNRILKALA